MITMYNKGKQKQPTKKKEQVAMKHKQAKQANWEEKAEKRTSNEQKNLNSNVCALDHDTTLLHSLAHHN